MFLWISLLFAIVALAVIGVVVFRHWKEIRLLDPDTIRQEQERKVRDRIVRQRFDRRLRKLSIPVQRVGRSIAERLTRSVRQIEGRLARTAGSVPRSGPSDNGVGETSEAVRMLLDEAASYADKGGWAQAERAYLEILKHDSRQLVAYRGLGRIYLAQKSYTQAKETFKFLDRIQGCDDACYAGMALIAEAEGNATDAEQFRIHAADAAPKNPIRHVELARFYLSHGSPDYAAQSAQRALELEPENPAFLELSLEAAILLADRTEALRLFDQLRAVSTDRQTLHAFQRKIDALRSS